MIDCCIKNYIKYKILSLLEILYGIWNKRMYYLSTQNCQELLFT